MRKIISQQIYILYTQDETPNMKRVKGEGDLKEIYIMNNNKRIRGRKHSRRKRADKSKNFLTKTE